jgi:chromosome segregation ATPase
MSKSTESQRMDDESELAFCQETLAEHQKQLAFLRSPQNTERTNPDFDLTENDIEFLESDIKELKKRISDLQTRLSQT